jgi:hypothetical protein
MKLGHKVAATTIRSVLIRARIPPAGKRSGLSWKNFLAAHAQTLIATDMFTVDTVLFKWLQVLFFLHLAPRQIMAATATSEPGPPWRAVGNATGPQPQHEARRRGHQLTVVIHDHDRKYPA